MSDPLVDLRGRVRDRAREQRQRRVAIGARVVAVLAVVAVLGWVATGSTLFSVKKIEVRGATIASADTIVEVAAIPLGIPLAHVDGAGVSRRLATVAAVGRADVAISLPDTVTINVTERSVAFVVDVGGAFAWIDGTGKRFHRTDRRPPGVPLASANPDDQALLSDVATVLGALPARMNGRVKLVVAQTRDSIVVRTTDRVELIWGSADDSPVKGQVAEALTTARPTCRVIDVSSPTHPTTRC